MIGDQIIHRALLDLEASVNALPFTMCERLGLGELRLTKIVLQLIDKSIRLLRGVVRYILR